jgi:hypothetical protein
VESGGFLRLQGGRRRGFSARLKAKDPPWRVFG